MSHPSSHSLLQCLTEYSQSDHYPFHMPGHKRNSLPFPNPWEIDITEIDGFDNLHHAEGILKDLQEEAAALFGAKKSFCLVNGSTCGLLATISACVKPGGKLLLSRNCHKSVYHGMYLRNITPVYMMPEMTDFGIMGSLSPDTVEEALTRYPDIQAVLVVSPTYDGVVSDIVSIAKIAHAHHLPLIVDEAHGAHFPLDSQSPISALACGADVVIQSLHKTLPAFTQTALLHVDPELVDEAVLGRFLAIYQSSSPSYLLMASMGQCFQILRDQGAELFEGLHKNLDCFYRSCSRLSHIQLFPAHKEKNCFGWDDSKILISASRLGLSGQNLHCLLLEKYHIQLEMASGHYALALASLMDRADGFRRLSEALKEIDAAKQPALINREKTADIINDRVRYRIPEQVMTISEAMEQTGRTILLRDSADAVSQEYIYLYPPGIPLLTPGERIDQALLANLDSLKAAGLEPEGLSDMTNTRINIVNS